MRSENGDSHPPASWHLSWCSPCLVTLNIPYFPVFHSLAGVWMAWSGVPGLGFL